MYFLPVHWFHMGIAHGLAHIPSVMRCEFYTTSRRVICCSWIQSHDHNTQKFISPCRKISSVTSSPSLNWFSLADKFIQLIKKMGECRGLWPSDGLLDNDVFRVSDFCDYGIYAGLRGAKKLISLKDEYRELENDGAKLPIDYKYYKGLSFSLQSWRIHGKFLRRWNELSSSFLSSSQKLFNKLSQGTFITFYEHN